MTLTTKSLGIPAGTSGGFDVYVGVADVDWASVDGGASDAPAAGETKTFTIHVDPSSKKIQQITVRFDSKYWADGAPFDYGTSVFEIDSISWSPTLLP